MKKYIFIIAIIIAIAFFACRFFLNYELPGNKFIGKRLDSLNSVIVYYNGAVGNNSGRNLTSDNYNLGLKYQCVEFVKRYYFEYLDHKMPDTYGNAKDFFDRAVNDGELNERRNLIQYKNGGKAKPSVNDLIIFDATSFNKYGHVAIVSGVTGNEIEIIQQNAGPYGKTRATFKLDQRNGNWYVNDATALGWLRK